MGVGNVETTPEEEQLRHKHRRSRAGSTFTHAVRVDRSTTGIPLRLHWQGRCWKVVAEPLRWYVRRPWWEEEYRVSPHSPFGVVEEEIWRLQITLTGNSQIRTVDVGHQESTGRWRLLYLHEVPQSA